MHRSDSRPNHPGNIIVVIIIRGKKGVVEPSIMAGKTSLGRRSGPDFPLERVEFRRVSA
jgi:hypothetical protein